MEGDKYKLIQETLTNFTFRIEEYEKQGFCICSNITTCMIQDTLYNTVLMVKLNERKTK